MVHRITNIIARCLFASSLQENHVGYRLWKPETGCLALAVLGLVGGVCNFFSFAIGLYGTPYNFSNWLSYASFVLLIIPFVLPLSISVIYFKEFKKHYYESRFNIRRIKEQYSSLFHQDNKKVILRIKKRRFFENSVVFLSFQGETPLIWREFGYLVRDVSENDIVCQNAKLFKQKLFPTWIG